MKYTRGYLVKEVEVTDPDTGLGVDISIYKHENGGMFAIDSSYIDQVCDEEEPTIIDPFELDTIVSLID